MATLGLGAGVGVVLVVEPVGVGVGVGVSEGELPGAVLVVVAGFAAVAEGEVGGTELAGPGVLLPFGTGTTSGTCGRPAAGITEVPPADGG